MFNNKNINFSIIIILLLLISCGREKKHLTARIYHNTTSYFNGYYNALNLFDGIVEELEVNNEFPYEDFITILNFGEEDEIQSYKADLEEIIKKNDIVIYKHPHGEYVDDCRLLNGKAYFYLQNYSLAMQNFDFLLEKFPESERVPETYLWIAMTFFQMDNSEMGLGILEDNLILGSRFVIDKELKGDLAVFRSRIAIERKNYKQAVEVLEDNIEFIHPQHRKARAHFLLGQLYEYLDDYPKSLTHYEEVIKHTNNYDFIFRTKMKMGELYVNYQAGKDDDEEVFKFLDKMLKDDKNEEYNDQIYYRLALLELKKDSINKGLDYLEKSIQTSTGDQWQKVQSYYQAGKIYFYDLLDYPNAQAYYDSAAQTVNESMPNYEEIMRISSTLGEYIQHKQTIHYQDSMLYLASLPEAEVDSLVDIIIAEEERKRKEAERRAIQEQLNNSNNTSNLYAVNNLANNSRNRNNNNSGGSWYFDNPTSVTNGQLQFQQIWGQRPDEDNWRRKNKSAIQSQSVVAGTDSTLSGPGEQVDSTLLQTYGDKYQYYKDIPTSEEQKEAVHKTIEEAIFALAQIYHLKLNELDSAINTYEYLLDRYEDTEYTLQARYALYTLYNEQGNPVAEAQKNFIVNEHPNTVYAMLVQNMDPDKIQMEQEEFEQAYEGVYNSFQGKQYYTALRFSEFLINKYEEKGEIDFSRIHYIRGISYGYLGREDSLREVLTYVIDQYPEAEVTPMAREVLNQLDGQQLEEPGMDESGSSVQVDSNAVANDMRFQGFTTEVQPNEKIFVLMYIDQDAFPKNEVNVKISNFNQEMYKANKLKVFVFLYAQTKKLLPYISRFSSIEDAKKYVSDFSKSDAGKELLSVEDAEIFYVTHSNFKIAYGKKRMDDYIAYYHEVLEAK